MQVNNGSAGMPNFSVQGADRFGIMTRIAWVSSGGDLDTFDWCIKNDFQNAHIYTDRDSAGGPIRFNLRDLASSRGVEL